MDFISFCPIAAVKPDDMHSVYKPAGQPLGQLSETEAVPELTQDHRAAALCQIQTPPG